MDKGGEFVQPPLPGKAKGHGGAYDGKDFQWRTAANTNPQWMRPESNRGDDREVNSKTPLLTS